MLSQQEQQRYSRQLMLPEIGTAGQLQLQAAKVLVIGAGGLGCAVVQYLAAAGVGNIGIADGDTVEESNLQRQILYTSQHVGQPKARIAKERLQQLNPFINITAHVSHVHKENILSLVAGYDIVVDGSDNFGTRYLVNDACVLLGKPLVFGSIYSFEGQVSVFNYQDGPTYRCIFPNPPQEDEMPNCATIGVVASLPGIVGTLQANEVIKIITRIGAVLSGRLLVIDALSMEMQCFRFTAVAANKQLNQLGDYAICCNTAVPLLAYDDLLTLIAEKTVQLIDVRSPEEHAAFNIGGINIPLPQLATSYQQLSASNSIVLYCASGVRSKQAALLLLQNGFTTVMSIRDGVRHLQAVSSFG